MQLLHRAIDARVLMEQAEIGRMCNANPRAQEYTRRALEIADLLARDTVTLPLLFERHCALRQVWESRRLRINALIEAQIAEEQQETNEKAWREEVNAHIAAGRWESLGMPSPENALAALLDGGDLDLNDHQASFDQGDDVVWCTNPYGIDLILCQGTPTLPIVTGFLEDMARGVTYGPAPY